MLLRSNAAQTMLADLFGTSPPTMSRIADCDVVSPASHSLAIPVRRTPMPTASFGDKTDSSEDQQFPARHLMFVFQYRYATTDVASVPSWRRREYAGLP